MVSLVSSLALFLAAQPGASAPSDQAASLSQVGDVISTARMCEAFGYTTDWGGLGDWAASQRDAVVAADAAFTSVAAQTEIERHVANQYARIYAVYWEGAMGRGSSADAVVEKQYRFVNLFRKRCDELARQPDAGVFVAAPEQDPGASQVIARITAGFEQARAAD